MPDTHVLLIKCTMDPQLIALLPERISAALVANQGTLVSSHWTVGEFDMVAIVELPSSFIPVFALQAESMDVTSMVVMRAFSRLEAQEALTAWMPAGDELPGATADDGAAVATDGDPGGKVGR